MGLDTSPSSRCWPLTAPRVEPDLSNLDSPLARADEVARHEPMQELFLTRGPRS